MSEPIVTVKTCVRLSWEGVAKPCPCCGTNQWRTVAMPMRAAHALTCESCGHAETAEAVEWVLRP
jgi:predicted RNA-binding Zn-ribbon protein involved in translation (DUF1610 family)